jgi:small redox-active disulfide protein 2
MEIKILGPGCPRCSEVERRMINALAQMNIAADVEKISDIQKIIPYQIITTPGLVIDGKVKCAGRIPSFDEIKTWILEAEGTQT